MTSRSLLPVFILGVAVSLPAAGCAPGPAATAQEASGIPPGTDPMAWEAAGREARVALALGRWKEAVAASEKRISLIPSPKAVLAGEVPSVEEILSVELYNLACARSLAGDRGAALDALEQAASGNLGRVGFDHLVRDPDLAPLHDEARWKVLVRRLSWNDSLEFMYTPAGTDSVGRPLIVGLSVPWSMGEYSGVPVSEFPGNAMVRNPRPCFRGREDRPAWTTRLDPGERAADRIAAQVERTAGERRLDRSRVVLLARGADEVRVAWEVLLRRPGVFTSAVLEGPAPPPWTLLDRGAEKMKTRIIATTKEGVPDPRVPVTVALAAGFDAAVAEALR